MADMRVIIVEQFSKMAPRFGEWEMCGGVGRDVFMSVVMSFMTLLRLESNGYLLAMRVARVWQSESSAVIGGDCWLFGICASFCFGNAGGTCVFDGIHVCFLGVFACLYASDVLVGSLTVGFGGALIWSADTKCEESDPSQALGSFFTTAGAADSPSSLWIVPGALTAF